MEQKPVPKRVHVHRKGKARSHHGRRVTTLRHRKEQHSRRHAHRMTRPARPTHRSHSAVPAPRLAAVHAGVGGDGLLLLPLALALAAYGQKCAVHRPS